MNLPIALAFLFFVGSCFGWVLELLFRRFFSKRNPERKWINPGFCTGPYVPLYGFGLCVLFLFTSLDSRVVISDSIWGEVILFSISAIAMTALEYVAGIFCLKVEMSACGITATNGEIFRASFARNSRWLGRCSVPSTHILYIRTF